MGFRDDLLASFGEDFFTPTTADRSIQHNWHELCVCGHLDRYHSTSIGGIFRTIDPTVRLMHGEEWTVSTALDGCVGALKPRGFEESTTTADQDKRTVVTVIHPTCPCGEFRAVARVDRPNRYFNQRMPRDRDDRARHPFAVGLRALSTHLGKRTPARKDPSWAAAEFDRRLQWLDGARVCGLSRCGVTEDVWPVFVDGADRSELRCPKHR